jgi:hypothetical protein
MSSGEKEHFSLGNFNFSSKKIHCSLRKLYFSLGIFFYSIGNLIGSSTRELAFVRQNYFLKVINFKNYLYVLWIFSSILFVEENNWEND